VRPGLLVLACLLACAHQRKSSGKAVASDPLWPSDEASLAERRTYFGGINAKVGELFPPIVRQRSLLMDPRACRYGADDHQVLMSFSLHADGTITDIQITTSSGVRFMDDSSIDALQEASPLPTPPAQIMAGREHVILPFSFRILKSSLRCYGAR
jgi:TonB family protein